LLKFTYYKTGFSTGAQKNSATVLKRFKQFVIVATVIVAAHTPQPQVQAINAGWRARRVVWKRESDPLAAAH
jgi:hypothetical protein